jgi:membrane-associated protease RseP (regulator of RpoE activity)
MKRPLLVLAFLLAVPMIATTARAGDADRDPSGFVKGKSTFAEVIAKFGPPAKSETNEEGLKAIAYTAKADALDAGAIFAFFGSADGVFMPGAPKAKAGDLGALTAFVFDRYGRLMYYRAVVNGGRPITSEDGAGPMPNVKITLSADQLQSSLPDDGKPHLGIQLVPIADLDAAHKKQFAEAHFDGLVVANVIPDSPGAQAGIVAGDYLYVLNGVLLSSFADAARAMAGVKKGDTVIARAKRIDETAHLAKETIFELAF